MARTRSPEYPYISLGDAVEKVGAIYDNEGDSPVSKEVIAEHCGYASYNGSAAKVLAALKKYELLTKTDTGFKLSQNAKVIHVLKGNDPKGDRVRALRSAADSVDLFSTLKDEFGLTASELNLKAQLQLRGFSKDGAGKAAKVYLSTMELISRELRDYDPSSEFGLASEVSEGESPLVDASSKQPLVGETVKPYILPSPSVDVRTEVFNLDDGKVVIEYPNELSVESYEDLSDYMELFLRKLKRRIIQ